MQINESKNKEKSFLKKYQWVLWAVLFVVVMTGGLNFLQSSAKI